MVVHSHYPHDETRVQRQAEALASQGIEVEVICLRYREEPKRDEVGGVKIHRLPVRRRRKRGSALQLFEYLAFFALAGLRLSRLHLARRFDAVQVHNLPDFLVLAALIPRLTGSKVILDIHDLMPEFHCSRFDCSLASWPARLLLLQERICTRFAHHVITVTEAWRQVLIKRGVDENRCSVVMNLADTRYFGLDQAKRCNGDGSEADERTGFHLIYHGTLARRYGIDLALQAVHQLRPQIPGLSFTIQGRGEDLGRLEGIRSRLKLEDCVEIQSEFLPADQLADLIRSADLGVVPYRNDLFTDGILPTKLMEYAALGVPVLAARTSGMASYFNDSMVQFFSPGDAGELAECIRTLHRHRGRLAQLADNAAEFNRTHSWQEESERYMALVRRLANGSARGSLTLPSPSARQ